jgi:intermembrane space import and assembly protein 40
MMSPGDLEEEADAQGAFNPETGEINWDCPCLGGMAHGPCGEQFRAAFSCFVYSTEEPKGMDCIEKFKGMQECFREHPDIYGDELAGEEDEPPESGSDDKITVESSEGSLAPETVVEKPAEKPSEPASEEEKPTAPPKET